MGGGYHPFSVDSWQHFCSTWPFQNPLSSAFLCLQWLKTSKYKQLSGDGSLWVCQHPTSLPVHSRVKNKLTLTFLPVPDLKWTGNKIEAHSEKDTWTLQHVYQDLLEGRKDKMMHGFASECSFIIVDCGGAAPLSTVFLHWVWIYLVGFKIILQQWIQIFFMCYWSGNSNRLKKILPGQITAVIIKFSFYYQFASRIRQ